MSIEHILGYIDWLCSDAMNNRPAFAKDPNEWTQLDHNIYGRREARSPVHQLVGQAKRRANNIAPEVDENMVFFDIVFAITADRK